MKRVDGHQNVANDGAAIVAIGNFDGVHLGHRALLQRARAIADARGGRVAVLTFDPHPAAVLAPHALPPMLASLDRRVELLGECGADVVVVEPFTRELAAASATAFIEDIVVGSLGATAIVVGYDFAYGAGRTGTVDSLRSHGAALGIEVDIVPAVEVGGEIASSTRIRNHLLDGDSLAAARLLGRAWDIDGVVVHGAKRGRTIGVPTANVRPSGELVIRPGIYAVQLEIDPSLGVTLPAVASYGKNPTFVQGGELVLEVHVLDWDGDLYDRRVRTKFAARLRDEAVFTSTDALIEQIRADIAAARAILTRE